MISVEPLQIHVYYGLLFATAFSAFQAVPHAAMALFAWEQT